MDNTITIGGLPVPIKLPELESVRQDLATELHAGRNGHRVWAAAVGLCWAGPRRLRADFVRSRFDVLAYGGEVYDELRSRGASGAEIIEAGVRCWRLLNGLPLDSATEEEQPHDLAEEVKASADFSGAGARST